MNLHFQTDKELAAWCDKLAETSAEAEKWVERNAAQVRNEKESMLKDLRKARRLFLSCARAAGRKMCAGVFGPSQAGKSYLISALAQGASARLDAVFGNDRHDFLSEINPTGGKESTGLVTRFTLNKITAPNGYPVLLSLLSETDIVKILANTYYADCEHKDEPKSDIAATLTRLRPCATRPNNRISLDDMEDLREYLYNDFRAKSRIQELERNYWDDALALAPKLDLEGRIALYALIWDEVDGLTQILRRLLQALEKLDHPENLFCSIDALIPRDTSIIDVATLANLASEDQTSPIDVQTPAGIKTQLPRAIVAALTAELAISMAEKPAEYFEHTDMLDFPGYRSRYKLDNLRRELEKKGMLQELFLRGKVAYLFQRYCARRELNSMLLCIGPSNQEVQDLPGVINAWVETTHGATPEERAGKPSSLFFILTKFDMEFEDKKGAPSLESRWDNRLHASLLDFFGKQHEWPHKWTPDQGFKNLFMLRNPNFRFDAIMEFDEDTETGIRPGRKEYVEKLKKAFLDSQLVAAHFHDPAKAWTEAMRLNDGGISHVRESLSPMCDPAIKRRQLEQNVESCRAALFRRLHGFYQSDDREELRNQKKKLILTLFNSLGKLEMQRQRLGQLLRCFTMNDTEIYALHSAALRRLRDKAREEEERQEISAETPQDMDMDNIDLLSFNPFMAAADNPSRAEKVPEDEASAFASLIESKWVENLHALADNPASQSYYMLAPQQFSALASELAIGAERLGFRKKMTDAFRKTAAYANTGQDSIARRQAAIAGRIINDFVDWLGHHPHSETAAERKVNLAGGKTVEVFRPQKPVTGLPILAEQRAPYTQKWFEDWLNALAGLILDNVNFNGETTVNMEENQALGAILRSMGNAA